MGGRHIDPAQPDPRTQHPRPEQPEQQQEHPGRESEMRPQPDFGEDSYVGLGRLEGKVALVTGGDSGIGRAVCVAFAREGADVAIAYLEEHDDAAETRRVVEAAGRRAMLLPGDLADPAHCKEIVHRTAEELGRLDILVNNAGFQGEEVDRIEELEPERIEHTFRTNVMAMFYTVQAALAHLEPGAAIINTTSIQSYDPSPGIADYAATKGAVTNLTKSLAKKLAERGIRVNGVAPGPVWTPLIPQSFEPDHVAHFGENTPLGRPAQPVELAPTYVFLASNESSFITGEVIGVTGGRLLP
jgi:NAD(P)-dependent dehydrogenase (short-subunit alcohol dehydrogenase family)